MFLPHASPRIPQCQCNSFEHYHCGGNDTGEKDASA